MKKILTTTAAVAAALAGTAIAAPAQAAPIPYPIGGDVSVVFDDVTYPAGGGCVSHDGALELWAGDDYAFYGADVLVDLTVTSSSGWVDGWMDTVLWSGSYTMTTQLCPYIDLPGSYTVSGTVTFWDDAGYDITSVDVHDTFSVRAYAPPAPPAPPAATYAQSVTKVATGAGKATVKVIRNGRAAGGVKVVWQRKSGGWKTVKKSTTNYAGRATLRGVRSGKYRAVIPAWGTSGKKTSAPFRIR